MEFDNFVSEPRWQILKLIANSPSSPVKISEKIGTSVAYVSQQLKLLEAARIVSKVRTKASQKGQPRIMYSIAEDVFYITSLLNKFPKKKKISPSERQKIVMKIWMIGDKKLEYLVEKLFWKVESCLEDIEEILIDITKNKIIIISKKTSVKTIVQNFLKEIKNKIDCEIILESNRKTDGLYQIYNSSRKNEEKEEAKRFY